MNLVLAVLKDSLHSAMESIRAKEDRVEQEKERLRRQNKEVEKRFRAISGQLMQLVKNGSI
jgi:chaperonin cofactor prefoldin